MTGSRCRDRRKQLGYLADEVAASVQRLPQETPKRGFGLRVCLENIT
jgi:hypothetical protein